MRSDKGFSYGRFWMSSAAPQFIDARRWLRPERRSALARFEDDVAVMFTASWEQPSTLVQRPDGTSRRKHLVCLQVPAAPKERRFHLVRSLTLHVPGSPRPLETDDIEGVSSRDLQCVTLAAYMADEPE